ncbi:MAG: DUF4301 family protein [Marinilabiliaceae bacterium]|nr:DUF4301 family protein [Marinilabiliaceae bacterium]
MLNNKEITQLSETGISEQTVLNQIERFKTGFKQLEILRAATPRDGIKILNISEIKESSDFFQLSVAGGLSVMKFVPASGAATRMFKDLYQYLENPVTVDQLPPNSPVKQFIEQLPKFAFFSKLQEIMKNHNLNEVNNRKELAAQIIDNTLNNKLLNYGKLPKGVLHFHKYPNNVIKTAMEEHFMEGCLYAKSIDNRVKIHFTVSPEHKELFKLKLDETRADIEKKEGISLDVNFSFQKPYTDTIAVTPDNVPFRDNSGNLVFRPGGHGALIENLNELDADIIFIKNIDNVVPQQLINDTVIYKKSLAGTLKFLQMSVFEYLNKLERKKIHDNLIMEICHFIKEELFVSLPAFFYKLSSKEKVDYLRKYLNRPIRVCGMVRNEGEPGGGPFWIKEKSGQESLQILESSQLDLNNPIHLEESKKSTHFNPVDLVCSTKDYKGKKFHLPDFLDPETGFISEKSINGQPIKALELPGLWNGAMANWITLFVEVPITTFNPVKTVNDFLRKQHQL